MTFRPLQHNVLWLKCIVRVCGQIVSVYVAVDHSTSGLYVISWMPVTVMLMLLLMRLLGNNGGAVTSGPAANWPVFPAECRRMFRGSTLTRRMRRTAARSFFSRADVRTGRVDRISTSPRLPSQPLMCRRLSPIHLFVSSFIYSFVSSRRSAINERGQ